MISELLNFFLDKHPSVKMRVSRTFKSSGQSQPSPDGAHIATILPSQLSIRSTRSLQTIRVISLPSELAACISWFLWSPSSMRILVGSSDMIKIYSTADSKFSATISHPVSVTKIAFVTFGANDDEVCIFSDFGLKLSIFSLATSRSIDISSPKFYNPALAQKGLSHRPVTSHLALLTRSGGKDIISIHAHGTLDIVRSWWPDTVDTQGIAWSSDGRWLVVWESASQGHRVLIYTADGHLFKAWNGPISVSDEEIDATLGAGIKLLDCSLSGSFVAVGDFSRRVTILSSPILSESISLLHPTAVKPAESLQIWQEQITNSQNGAFLREFVLATQTIYPPPTGSMPNSEPKTGTNTLTFDHSSTLLATRVEDMATTIWIWDINTRILRAVLILHAPIAKATWHPSIDELLMVRCEGEENRGLVHLWDPSWETPKIVDFNTHMPGGKVLGKTIVRWLNIESPLPVLFFSDTQDYMFVSMSGAEGGDLPWEESEARDYDIYGEREQSPLNLVPANEKREGEGGRVSLDELMDDGITMSEESDEMEDTFHFRKFVPPKESPNPWT